MAYKMPPQGLLPSRAAASGGFVTGNIGIGFEVRGAAGIITLDRPKALNAITHDMVLAMRAQLDAWMADDAVAACGAALGP